MRITLQEELDELLAALADDPVDRPPLGRPIHLTSGTTGRPKGVFSGLLEPAEAEALLRAGEAKPDPKLEPVEVAAYAAVCRLLLNLDETVTKE